MPQAGWFLSTSRCWHTLNALCAQSEALSYSMWVLSGHLGFVRLQGFTPADLALFNQLVTALSKSLAHQVQVSGSQTSFICHKRRQFYLSHLPACFSNVTKRSMLSSSAVFADSLFRDEDVERLLEATRSSLSLKSQQAVMDITSRRSSASTAPALATLLLSTDAANLLVFPLVLRSTFASTRPLLLLP